MLLFFYVPSTSGQSDPVVSFVWEMLNENKLEEALLFINSSIDASPQKYSYLLLRAEINLQKGEPEKVFSDVDSYLKALPPNSQVFLLQGEALLAKSLNNEALLAFSRAHNYSDGATEEQYCQLKMAEAHNNLGNFKLAREKLELIRNAFPSSLDYLYNLGRMQIGLFLLEDAEKTKMELVKLYGKNIKTYDFLTSYYQQRGNYKAAAESYYKKLELSEYDSAGIALLYELAVMAKDTSTMILAIEKQVKLNPQNCKSIIELANLYYEKNNFTVALYRVNQALNLQQDNPLLYKIKGDIYKATNLNVQSCDYYFIALKKGYSLGESSTFLGTYIQNCE